MWSGVCVRTTKFGRVISLLHNQKLTVYIYKPRPSLALLCSAMACGGPRAPLQVCPTQRTPQTHRRAQTPPVYKNSPYLETANSIRRLHHSSSCTVASRQRGVHLSFVSMTTPNIILTKAPRLMPLFHRLDNTILRSILNTNIIKPNIAPNKNPHKQSFHGPSNSSSASRSFLSNSSKSTPKVPAANTGSASSGLSASATSSNRNGNRTATICSSLKPAARNDATLCVLAGNRMRVSADGVWSSTDEGVLELGC